MGQLFIRNPNGDSQWTEDAAAVCRSFANHVREALCDAEEYGPVDLRDLQTILKSAIDDVILHEMVCRRLKPDPQTGPEREEESVVRDNLQTTDKERVWVNGEWQDW